MSPATHPPRIRLDVAPLLRRSDIIGTFAYRSRDAPLNGRAFMNDERPARSGHFKSSIL